MKTKPLPCFLCGEMEPLPHYDGRNVGPYCDDCFDKLRPDLLEWIDNLLAKIKRLENGLKSEKHDNYHLRNPYASTPWDEPSGRRRVD